MRRIPAARLGISIHALREEGDDGSRLTFGGSTISIHALREEGDRFKRRQDVKLTIFLSTPSARRATESAANSGATQRISIHALREEGDDLYRFIADFGVISIHALREEGDRCQCGHML